ncbi:hypothetical protein PIB30_038249 [Stylosanthes scabra]|uniref:Uncharacterized protein n=1 Tax=Stylosanthes scabra TaxID=79078 RepID=A0ABU6VCR0_9FABA|nr:hypothetical protein [Stylosanthes scabra]
MNVHVRNPVVPARAVGLYWVGSYIKTPTQYASDADKAAEKEIQEYQDWRIIDDYNVRDQAVKKIGPSADYLLQIKKLANSFETQIPEILHWKSSILKPATSQLSVRDLAVKKIGPSADYLLQIKKLANSFEIVGAPKSNH